MKTIITPRLLVLSAALVACSEDARPLGAADQEISGGVPDAADTAVVGIYIDTNGATCTGSLIAPNLVLTGRHCVAQLPPQIDCTSAFGPTIVPSAIYVTTQANMSGAAPSDFYPASAVEVEPGPGLLCGDDVALIVLASNIPPGEATPLTPRVDASASVGEMYAAVGYGATTDFGTDGGERRRRDDLVVQCVGAACGASAATSEWQGNEGICPGDSGGPALDQQGRVFGVVSRGAVGCVSPVYGDVAAHGDWITAEAVEAAALGGYPIPRWAGGPPTGTGGGGFGGSDTGGAAPVTTGSAATTGSSGETTGATAASGSGGAAGGDDESSEEDGCQCAPASKPNLAASSVVLLALVASSLRRRRLVPACFSARRTAGRGAPSRGSPCSCSPIRKR